MKTPRTTPAGRPSRPTLACLALGVSLAAVLVVIGSETFAQSVLGERLGLAIPLLVVRLSSTVLGTATAGLLALLAVRLFGGPIPAEKQQFVPPPGRETTLSPWPDPGKGDSKGNVAMFVSGKEESPWT